MRRTVSGLVIGLAALMSPALSSSAGAQGVIGFQIANGVPAMVVAVQVRLSNSGFPLTPNLIGGPMLTGSVNLVSFPTVVPPPCFYDVMITFKADLTSPYQEQAYFQNYNLCTLTRLSVSRLGRNQYTAFPQ